MLFVAHAGREGRIRIISARRATRRERRQYERILLAAGARPVTRDQDGKTVVEALLRSWPAGCRGVDRQLVAVGATAPLRATKFGEAAVVGQVGADRLTLVRAYAYALEEGSAQAQQWTVSCSPTVT